MNRRQIEVIGIVRPATPKGEHYTGKKCGENVASCPHSHPLLATRSWRRWPDEPRQRQTLEAVLRQERCRELEETRPHIASRYSFESSGSAAQFLFSLHPG